MKFQCIHTRMYKYIQNILTGLVLPLTILSDLVND